MLFFGVFYAMMLLFVASQVDKSYPGKYAATTPHSNIGLILRLYIILSSQGHSDCTLRFILLA